MDGVLKDMYTEDYARDLSASYLKGENRIKKVTMYVGKLTLRNPLLDFIKNNAGCYKEAIRYQGDRALVFSALINSVCVLGYDTTCVLGRYFHVQDEVSTRLITNRLGTSYCGNRTLVCGLSALLPMYVEAGLICRPRTGFYAPKELKCVTTFAETIYKKSFLIHNSTTINDDCDGMEHDYFEFL